MSSNQLKSFLVKSLIGGVIAAMLGLFLIEAAVIEAEDSVSRITKQLELPNYFPGQGKLSAATERLAANLKAMPPQRREELIALLRVLVVELRPFAVELLPLFMDPHTEQ